MTAKHGRSARPSPRDDGPPTDQLPPSGPARRRRVGARSAARRPLSVRLSGLSRRTVVIVAAVAVVLLAVAVVGYLVATSPEEVGTTEATGHQLTYRATSSDNTTSIRAASIRRIR